MDLKQLHEDMNTVFTQLKEANEKMQGEVKQYGEATGETKGMIDKLNTRLDELEVKMKRPPVNTESKKYGNPEEQKAVAATMDYMRKGIVTDDFKALQTKAMSTDSDPDGGYLVPDAVESRIIELVRDFSPVRQVAAIYTVTSGTALKIPREGDTDFEAGWVGERQARPKTDTGKLEMIRISVNEMYAQPAATQQILDDPAFGFESYINRKIANRFARLEGYAFINGDGVNKPEGLLVSSEIDALTATLDFDSLMNLQSQLRQEYKAGASWMMNRFTLRYIRTLKDGNGQYLWQPSMQIGQPNTILGDTYNIADDMPNAESNGSLVTGATPILYGNFQEGYAIVDKQGVRILRDPYTDKPNVLFYTTKQVGGQVINKQAIKKLKLS